MIELLPSLILEHHQDQQAVTIRLGYSYIGLADILNCDVKCFFKYIFLFENILK